MSNRIGDWIQTASGRRFWALDPRPEDIEIHDIAHALSNQCRFGGHTREFYCVVPETKILNDRFAWIQAGDAKVGDGLTAFDEFATVPGSCGKNRRRIRHAVIRHNKLIKRVIYRLRLEDGTVLRCSEDHPWLIATKISKNQLWMTTKQIASDLSEGRRRYLLRFCNPWPTLDNWEGGYAAGLLDGEGYVSYNGGGLRLGFAQNPGAVLNSFTEFLRKNKFGFVSIKNPQSRTFNVTIHGDWSEKLRLLGMVSSQRLTNSIQSRLILDNCAPQFNSKALLLIVEASYEGKGEVAAIETSTGTYFAEGFGAHNSVAQHSVIVSLNCPSYPLHGLLHDASEAYLIDLPRPIKKSLLAAGNRWFLDAEERIMSTIWKHFGLSDPVDPSRSDPAIIAEIKHADNMLLATEARDFMSPLDPAWQKEWLDGLPTLPDPIDPWSPKESERAFLMRFHTLRALCGTCWKY